MSPLVAEFGLLDLDVIELLDGSIGDCEEAESLDNVDDLIALLLFSNPAFLLVNLEDGLAGGDVDTKLLCHCTHRLSTLDYPCNDG